MNRQIKGIWIPIEIWEAENLSWNEKILFLEIDSYTTKEKDCYMSNEYIADLLKVTKESASRILSSLISKGYVIKTHFDGRKRYVKTAFSYNSNVKADLTQMIRQTKQECEGSISTNDKAIYNNKERINKHNNKECTRDEKSSQERTSRKTLFCNSIIGKSLETFLTYFTEPAYTQIDMTYYYYAVYDWSNSSNTMRTERGWKSTINNFIRGDKEKGRLHTLQQEDAFRDYFKLGTDECEY